MLLACCAHTEANRTERTTALEDQLLHEAAAAIVAAAIVAAAITAAAIAAAGSGDGDS